MDPNDNLLGRRWAASMESNPWYEWLKAHDHLRPASYIAGLGIKPYYVHLVGQLFPLRPGVRLFARRLELDHYPPNTARNDQFLFNLIDWEGMVFYVLSIPKRDWKLARKLAPKCGVRIADGIPTLVDVDESGKLKGAQFPLATEDTYTLENIKDHPLYRVGRGEREEMFEYEETLIESLEAAFKVKNKRR